MRLEGRDSDREAGTLGIDQAQANLAGTVLPRLASEGVIALARDQRDAEGQPVTGVETQGMTLEPYDAEPRQRAPGSHQQFH